MTQRSTERPTSKTQAGHIVSGLAFVVEWVTVTAQ